MSALQSLSVTSKWHQCLQCHRENIDKNLRSLLVTRKWHQCLQCRRENIDKDLTRKHFTVPASTLRSLSVTTKRHQSLQLYRCCQQPRQQPRHRSQKCLRPRVAAAGMVACRVAKPQGTANLPRRIVRSTVMANGKLATEPAGSVWPVAPTA